MRLRYFAAQVLTIAIAGAGCDSLLESSLEERPPHIIATASLYTSLAGFETGLNGLYSLARNDRAGQPTSGDATLIHLWMNGVDNMTGNVALTPGFQQIAVQWGSFNTAAHTTYRDAFVWLYGMINAANTIINQAESRDDIDWSGGGASATVNKNRVIAEARAIRALAYRHLTYGWGDVPLSLEESRGSTIRTDWERTPVAQVRAQIVEDLSFAQEHVPVEGSLPGRLTKGAVQHYLAEMYLVLDGYGAPSTANATQALQWTNQVIDNTAYQLVTARYGARAGEPGVAFMDMFHEGNTNRSEGNSEALWVYQYDLLAIGGGNSRIRRAVTPPYDRIVRRNAAGDRINPVRENSRRGGSGTSRMALTNWAMENYDDPNDDRFSNYAIRQYFTLRTAQENAPAPADLLPAGKTFGDTIMIDWSEDITPTNSSVFERPFTRKYEELREHNLNERLSWKDQIRLRLAETYLLRAEAQFRLGDAASAAASINTVRRRSGAREITPAQVSIDFILDERARELLAEEDRRYHLLRTERWLDRIRLYNNRGGQFVTNRDLLFPIPQAVIDANLTAAMPQNPGF